ncbi:hypothetical protein V493_01970 [Pseudogymnoascus sp. VKM F-4281 (FW-2241)]|nr:hypothetical protein V493_01970 [Pseudogymnoascus sp. VKM F-4281 (FW-2241)]
MDWEQIENIQVWCYVHAAVSFVTAFVLFVIWLVAFGTVRRRHDPARVAVTWLKLVFLFEIPGLILTGAAAFAESGSEFLSYQYGRGSAHSNKATYNTITLAYEVQLRTGSIGGLLRNIAGALLVVTFIEFANGLMFALTKQQTSSQKILRWIILASAFLLIVLSIAFAGLANTAIYNQWYAVLHFNARENRPSASDIDAIVSQGIAYSKLGGAHSVIGFIVSLGVIVYVSIVMHYYTTVSPSRIVAVNLLLAAITYFIRSIWFLVVAAVWTLPPAGTTPYLAPATSYGTNVFLDIILFAITLIILFAAGVRKKKGLWTTLQPWMGGVLPEMVGGRQPVVGQQPQQPQQPVVYYQYPPNGFSPQQQAQGGYPQYGYLPPQGQGGVYPQYGFPPQQHGQGGVYPPYGFPPQQQAQGANPLAQEIGGIARQEAPPGEAPPVATPTPERGLLEQNQNPQEMKA